MTELAAVLAVLLWIFKRPTGLRVSLRGRGDVVLLRDGGRRPRTPRR